MRRLANHIARETPFGCEFDGFVVGEIQHFHRGVVGGIANQCCGFAGAGGSLDQ